MWKMIYGDWESRNEQPPVLLNAMKAVNPSMHYDLNQMHGLMGDRYSFVCSGAFPSAWMPLVIVVLSFQLMARFF